jgi:hypothetical protein
VDAEGSLFGRRPVVLAPTFVVRAAARPRISHLQKLPGHTPTKIFLIQIGNKHPVDRRVTLDTHCFKTLWMDDARLASLKGVGIERCGPMSVHIHFTPKLFDGMVRSEWHQRHVNRFGG